MIQRCDVAIVGLGPAGASAAIAAAQGGARVIALDRRREAGFPVQCAEFVPAMMGMDAGPVTSAQVQPILAMESFVENAHDRHTPDFRGKMIDRGAFDRQLVEQAMAAGADCRFGMQVAVDRGDGALVAPDGARFVADVVIGADGPNSPLGAAIGCVNRELVETRQVTVPLLAPQDSTDIYLSTRIPGGYAWLFPKGDVANVGLGVGREWRELLKPELEALLAMLVEQGKIADKRLGHTGGAIPVGGPVGVAGRIGGVQVLLAGDAAGLANPVTGAGIPAACISGKMAGEAAARIVAGDRDALADYYDDIEDLFGASLRRAVARRRELLAQWRDGTAEAADLRRGWIAYPQYWTDTKQVAPMAQRENGNELLEA
ncbi:MAG: NAD(P)/FAD-dependent oxidoreductase [Sphingomonadales bacterium]|nr:NAD(P)/FAD-dependent oxidoreductase [Sphingomonadales bacterium]MBD3772669.1 NAD(P)/FAD-dependent oxidoreductase [Paracoccaceae bacterium]